jgi:biotin synthase
MTLEIGKEIDALVAQALTPGLTETQACRIATAADAELPAIFYGADALRRLQFGNQVKLCAVVNAKSGKCGQDCAFCAQSTHHNANIETYDFLSKDAILEVAEKAKAQGAGGFSVVTSGRKLSGTDVDAAAQAVESVVEMQDLYPCASLGALGEADLGKLKRAGLKRYHHNLETAKSFYGSICTTRDWEENVESIRAAKRAGLEVCCGGIFGLGESPEQRVELAFQIKALEPESVPLNFLNPIPKTPLENTARLTPMECLRIIALFRYVMPRVHLPVCGGREVNLRQLQPMIFHAGASGMMVGNYLTTQGRSAAEDLAMLEELGLIPSGEGA